MELILFRVHETHFERSPQAISKETPVAISLSVCKIVDLRNFGKLHEISRSCLGPNVFDNVVSSFSCLVARSLR